MRGYVATASEDASKRYFTIYSPSHHLKHLPLNLSFDGTDFPASYLAYLLSAAGAGLRKILSKCIYDTDTQGAVLFVSFRYSDTGSIKHKLAENASFIRY